MHEKVYTPDSTVVTSLPGEVVEWSLDRDLSGAGVPGQARAVSGLVSAGGSVTLKSLAGEAWKPAVLPGGTVTVDAKTDIDSPASRVFTGRSTRVSAPSALTPVLNVEIADNIPKEAELTLPHLIGRQQFLPLDSAYLIAQAARACGFLASPRKTAGALLHVGFEGIVDAQAGSVTTVESMFKWRSSAGRIGLSMGYGGKVELVGAAGVTEGEYVFSFASTQGTLGSITDFALSASFRFGSATEIAFNVQRWPNLFTFGSDSTYIPDAATTGYAVYEVSLTFSAGSIIAKARVQTASSLGAWSSPITQPYAWSENYLRVTTVAGDDTMPLLGFSDLHWLTFRRGSSGDGLFKNSAFLDLSGFALPAVLVEKQKSAWAYLQQVTGEVMGASGIDEDGHFFFMGKDRLRGLDNPSLRQVGVDGLADLPWSISDDDVADRVTVTYAPVDELTTSSATQTVWEATEVIQVNAGATRTITVDLEGVMADHFGGWSYDENFNATSGSRWHVYRTRSGTDSVVPTGEELQVVTEVVNPARVRIRITNTTASTLWIRDEGGGPYLILRARYTARRGEQMSVEIGAPEDKAVAPFSHDGGTSIQAFEDASSLAAWLFAVLSEPLPVLESVEVVPDPSHRIGQVITIYDPLFTGIRARAIIAGVSQSGAAGSYKQTLKLALLAVTVDDALSFAETLTNTNTIGALFDAVETLATSKGVVTTSIEDLIDFWDPESVVIE